MTALRGDGRGLPRRIRLILFAAAAALLLILFRQALGQLLWQIALAVLLAYAALPVQGAVMKPAGKARGWCCAAAALCCLLAVAGCLLWTPTHYDTLYGLQGRYFLPVLPLLLLTCLPRRLAAVPDEDTAQTRLVAALALVQAGMVVNIMLAIIAR